MPDHDRLAVFGGVTCFKRQYRHIVHYLNFYDAAGLIPVRVDFRDGEIMLDAVLISFHRVLLRGLLERVCVVEFAAGSVIARRERPFRMAFRGDFHGVAIQRNF